MLGEQLSFRGRQHGNQLQRGVAACGHELSASVRKAFDCGLDARRVVGLGIEGGCQHGNLLTRCAPAFAEGGAHLTEHAEQFSLAGLIEFAEEFARNELHLGKARHPFRRLLHHEACNARPNKQQVDGQRGDERRLEPWETAGGGHRGSRGLAHERLSLA